MVVASARPEIKENPEDKSTEKAEALAKKIEKAEAFAKKNILKYQSEQAELCRNLTGGCEVTDEEYKNASQEFQTLLEIPRKKGEPLYILPEFDESGKVRKELEELRKLILEGRPYHEFVKNQSYGIIWPIVLRAYLGLKDGFQISMDQMDSILKIAYWNQILESENLPLVEKDDTTLTAAGKKLVSKLFTKEQSEKFLKRFIFEMKNEPRAEGDLQVIKLTDRYLRFAVWALGVRGSGSMDVSLLAQEDLEVINEDFKRNGPFNNITTLDIEQAGASMFRALVKSMVPLYRVHLLIDKDGIETPCLILPSATILRVYQHVVNPDRTVKFVRRVGIFSLHVMEEAFDHDYRVGNEVAPGTTSMIKEHQHIVSPCLATEHDKYHYYLESQHLQRFHHACTQLKKTLWEVYPYSYSREVVRLIDREIVSSSDLVTSFTDLLHSVFSKDKSFKLSICIPFADILGNFAKYGFSEKDVLTIVRSFFKCADETYSQLFKVSKSSNAMYPGDISFISIILAIKFKLQGQLEPKFIKKLCFAHTAGLEVCEWRKSLEDGSLEPVILLRNQKGSFLRRLDKLPPNYIELFDNACNYLREQKVSGKFGSQKSGTSFITLLSYFSKKEMLQKRALKDLPRDVKSQFGVR